MHSVYGFGMVNGGHYIREALLHWTKSLLLPAGTGLETRSEQQVELMRGFGATVIVGFVDYIKRLAQVARDKGIVPGRDVRIRMISGHVGREDRDAISAAWGGAEVYDWYGVADTGIVAAEGPDHDGLYVWEDAHVLEIIDPDTGAPRLPGEPGNMCVTALFKDGVYPIVRFDTNDVSAFLTTFVRGLTFRRIRGFEDAATRWSSCAGSTSTRPPSEPSSARTRTRPEICVPGRAARLARRDDRGRRGAPRCCAGGSMPSSGAPASEARHRGGRQLVGPGEPRR